MAKNKNSIPAPSRAGKPKNTIKVQRELEITYQGPLPDPATFASYERTTEGAADRILNMAEREQSHRHEMERLMTDSYAADICQERREAGRAQWMAWSLAFGVIIIGGFLVYSGHSVVGTLLTGGTLVGIVSAFLKNKTEKKEANEKHTPVPSKK